ncbi:hypothetical protein CDAR_238801 [Caerostris darwini]|uniref:Secreted protein n=1 Tax=Caerostris darwini TaxID=1538125 RepID=A0AAV4PR29_9ARAC|nr:hypothetical protein CDAR_238801 [Caerostris darwini]
MFFAFVLLHATDRKGSQGSAFGYLDDLSYCSGTGAHRLLYVDGTRSWGGLRGRLLDIWTIYLAVEVQEFTVHRLL